ncbi:hypothetical protein L484_023136 [Morus notabilis]|uniref:Uncharacterized protein n=1 Tax=Morus notabilis TaxID=981085 RepID=W9S6L0_9ROSA|nr:hypothetical protein L484_023136 [Morus notabilis]
MAGTCGRWQRLEMPMFSGEYPDSWIVKVEEYHQKNQFSEREKIWFAEEFMEDEALDWFQWEDRSEPFVCWNEFKMNLLQRFRPTQRLLSETNMKVWPQNVGMISDLHVSGSGSSQPDLERQNRQTTLEKTRRDLESREADGTLSNFSRSGAISLRSESIDINLAAKKMEERLGSEEEQLSAVWEGISKEMDGVKGDLQKIPAREKNVMLILGKLDLLMRNQGEKSPGIKGTSEDLPSSHSKRTAEDGSGGGSGTGLNRIIELAQRVEDRNMALKVAKGMTSSTWIRQQPHIQPFRSQSASLLKTATPNDKSYGLSPNDKLFSPRGDSSEIEWDPNWIWTGLRDSRARDEGKRAGLGEIAPDLEDPRRKGLFRGGLWSEGERWSRAATFGAGLTISDAAEAGLGNLAAVWTGTHDSGDVEAVSGWYSSDPLNSGDIMVRAWKFGSKPRVGGAEFRNSGQMRAGSRVSGVGRTDSCVIGSRLRNSNIIGPTSGSIGVGPKNFSESGTNFNKLCNGSSNFGPNWTGSGNSNTPGARAGEIDFIGVELGHSANRRCDIFEFVTPKTKISMFHGLNNGSNGFFALDYTSVAPFPPWFVTIEVGSSRIAMPFNILEGGLDDMGRRWRHSTAVT